jgi:hypothetical protein
MLNIISHQEGANQSLQGGIISPQLEWLLSKQKITNADKDLEKKELSYIICSNIN